MGRCIECGRRVGKPTHIHWKDAMIKVLDHMPIGTIGFEATGKVTKEDYEGVLVPAVAAAVDRGPVRLLYVLGEDFESYSPGAMWSDTRLWSGQRDAWERVGSRHRRQIGSRRASKLSVG